ncbi:MAG: hypothetical protein KJN90_14965 [Gammaproteobacteria bacterium]|nr:hypothetical protein [Gammaproteobacteria bacterium]
MPIVSMALVLAPSFSYSQTSDLQLDNNLTEAREALRQLDELANNCLEESDRSEPCAVFLQAVDGDLLDGYLENCAAAKSWREELVAEQAQNPSVSPTQSDALLRRLIDVEYLCGENSLSRATENVFPAYQLTRSRQLNGAPIARSLQYQLNSARQNALLNQQRDSLFQDLSSQSERNRRQIQRQSDRLEIELIRQQNNQLLPR